MSKDFRLLHACPHETLEERVFLATDRRSLLVRQPVASHNSVRVLANDEFLIPQFGLFSQAQLTSRSSGPYNIPLNENDLTISSRSETVSLLLPTGPRVETDLLVQTINTEADTIFAENSNGHLVLTETGALGRDSLIRTDGRARTPLGFDVQRQVLGRQVYPGWRLEPREDPSLTNLFPRFVAPVKQNAVLKVSYVTLRTRCRRCQATGNENDYRFDSQGQALFVENENLLNQAALKIILTTKGSNPFHSWYGTTIRSRIGQKAVGVVASLISEDVRRALEALQRMQVEQSRGGQAVSFKERLFQITSVQTFPHRQDPTTFLVDVFVRNASREPVNVSVVFSVPSVVALLGSNGLVLGDSRALTTTNPQFLGRP